MSSGSELLQAPISLSLNAEKKSWHILITIDNNIKLKEMIKIKYSTNQSYVWQQTVGEGHTS